LLKVTSDKKNEINKECSKQLAEIEAVGQRELAKILSVEQIEKFEHLAGKKLGEPDEDIWQRYRHGTSKENNESDRDRNDRN